MAVCSMPALQGMRAVLRPNFHRRRRLATSRLATSRLATPTNDRRNSVLRRENVRLRLDKESKPASDRPKHITQGRNA